MLPDTNIDHSEVSKFNDLAHRWWDSNGDFKPLHDINPIRADFVERHAGLNGKRVLDIGCGGGVMSEEMHRRGAKVTGIDAGETVIQVAELHQAESGTAVEYRALSAEQLRSEGTEPFDVITCLELLEHVPDAQALVHTCAELVRPGGDVFFSTINRNAKSWLMAILGAEYVLGLLPKGTHDYRKLIRPSELAAWSRATGLEVRLIEGMSYNPFSGQAALGKSLDINYIAWLKRPA